MNYIVIDVCQKYHFTLVVKIRVMWNLLKFKNSVIFRNKNIWSQWDFMLEISFFINTSQDFELNCLR